VVIIASCVEVVEAQAAEHGHKVTLCLVPDYLGPGKIKSHKLVMKSAVDFTKNARASRSRDAFRV
jgi:hypothetical protein